MTLQMEIENLIFEINKKKSLLLNAVEEFELRMYQNVILRKRALLKTLEDVSRKLKLKDTYLASCSLI